MDYYSLKYIQIGISLFFVGGLADRYGRKPLIIVGLIVFAIGSLFCLYAPNYIFLLIGRFFQGIGIAAPKIFSFLIVADSYPLAKQQSLMALLNGFMNASTGAAPVNGSYITLYFYWQGNFIVLLSLALVTLLLAVFYIPAYKIPENKEPLSLQGYLPIFRSKPLVLLIFHIVFMFVPYLIFVGMTPILYREDLGVSLSHFGYYQGALALVFAAGSLVFGLIINKFSSKTILSLAYKIFIVSFISIGIITFLNCTNPFIITLSILPFIIGQIIPSTILYPLCLNFLPEAKGRLSAMIQGMYLILSALGLQINSYFYQGSFQNIGIIIFMVIFVAAITLFWIIKNKEIMKSAQTLV